MNLTDRFEGMKGKLSVYKQYEDGSKELVFGPTSNSISYRAKTIMSRLLASGMNASGTFDFGTAPLNTLAITGMAFGNGGHLIYNADGTTGTPTPLTKTANPLILDSAAVTGNVLYPAMPKLGATWGYNTTALRTIPGSTYEKVENGNIPWDGTLNIQDNAIGVSQAHTTLYSETFRLPLDVLDGISTPTNTEVQFKCTIPQNYLNYAGLWGFSAQPANIISEAGLIVGYVPALAAIATGQVYSTNGNEPALGAFAGYDFGAGVTNFHDDVTMKEGTLAKPLYLSNNSTPQVVSNGTDTFPGGTLNTWNLFSRKNFSGIPKTNSFSLVFVWAISF
jgi:hypothetical protein